MLPIANTLRNNMQRSSSVVVSEPIRCVQCNVFFGNLKALAAHKRWVHSTSLDATSDSASCSTDDASLDLTLSKGRSKQRFSLCLFMFMFIYVHVYSLSFRLDASDSDDSTHQVSPTWTSDDIFVDKSDCYFQEESTGATYDASRVL